MIPTLIETVDTVEVIKAKIAQILTTEIASQMAKATAASEDPDLWKVRIFLERNAPFEEFLAETITDTSPLCNITFYDSNLDGGSGNLIGNFVYTSKFWIDCYGYSKAYSTDDGHMPGDEAASVESMRAVRLVRAILMAGEYVHLGLRPTVSMRKVARVTQYKPTSGDNMVQNISFIRIELEVRHGEVSPQVATVQLKEIFATIYRGTTGQIHAYLEYDVE
jgi:hypothetical protein